MMTLSEAAAALLGIVVGFVLGWLAKGKPQPRVLLVLRGFREKVRK